MLARTDPDRSLGHKGLSLFVVEKPSFPGHEWEATQDGGGHMEARAIPTIGYRGMHSFEVSIDRWRVPHPALIGEDEGLGRGFYLQMQAFANARLQTAARAQGVMQSALEQAVAYAQQRQVFGTALADYELNRTKIARMAALLAACRVTSFSVARALARGDASAALEASQLKQLSCRVAEWVTREALADPRRLRLRRGVHGVAAVRRRPGAVHLRGRRRGARAARHRPPAPRRRAGRRGGVTVTVIAHLSDPHLDGSEATRDRWRTAVAYLHGLHTPVDAVLVTGDIVEGSASGELAWAAEVLGDATPVGWCPGNSDTRAAFRTELATGAAVPSDPSEASGGPLDAVLDVDDLRIVLLDSLVEGEIAGELAPATLTWLEDRLAEVPDGTHVLVALHHPPTGLGHPGIDPLGLREPAGLAAVVARAPQVIGTLVGHAHAGVATTFAGRPLRVAPGIHSQLVLPWEITHDGPPFIDEQQPPAMAVHVVHDGGRLTTYHRTLASPGDG